MKVHERESRTYRRAGSSAYSEAEAERGLATSVRISISIQSAFGPLQGNPQLYWLLETQPSVFERVRLWRLFGQGGKEKATAATHVTRRGLERQGRNLQPHWNYEIVTNPCSPYCDAFHLHAMCLDMFRARSEMQRSNSKASVNPCKASRRIDCHLDIPLHEYLSLPSARCCRYPLSQLSCL
jgi:hypothetical protein